MLSPVIQLCPNGFYLTASPGQAEDNCNIADVILQRPPAGVIRDANYLMKSVDASWSCGIGIGLGCAVMGLPSYSFIDMIPDQDLSRSKICNSSQVEIANTEAQIDRKAA